MPKSIGVKFSLRAHFHLQMSVKVVAAAQTLAAETVWSVPHPARPILLPLVGILARLTVDPALDYHHSHCVMTPRRSVPATIKATTEMFATVVKRVPALIARLGPRRCNAATTTPAPPTRATAPKAASILPRRATTTMRAPPTRAIRSEAVPILPFDAMTATFAPLIRVIP
jgi:hypothetical protein